MESGLHPLRATGVEVLQVNVGKVCNQSCRHCHVEAGPNRTEAMTRETMQWCLEALSKSDIRVLDITGGAPELNPNFRWLVEQARRLGREVLETIVVDAGSEDGTVGLAAAHGARIIRAARCRARQMNVGAAAARGPLLLFLHADTRLPQGFEEHIRSTLGRPAVVAGAFELGIDSPMRSLRIIETGANFRARWLHVPYGDQGLFMRASVFHSVGGFPDLPIMEDFELVRRLRRRGRIVIVHARVATSPRRWQRLGPWRTTWTNQMIVLGYYLGVSPGRLAKWYCGGQGAAAEKAKAGLAPVGRQD